MHSEDIILSLQKCAFYTVILFLCNITRCAYNILDNRNGYLKFLLVFGGVKYIFRNCPNFTRFLHSSKCKYITVHFILVCQRLFGDNFFITCFFELKLSWCVSTFLYNQEQNFSLIRQKTKILPIDPHYNNHTLL